MPPKVSAYDYLTCRNKKSNFLSPVDENEVIHVLSSCENKTSSDCDGIDFRLVENVISFIIKLVTHICNTSFQTGIFPENMKVAKVIPLFKSGSKSDISNYRPISLLPQFSNNLEKLYNNRFNTFIKMCAILNSMGLVWV